MSLPAYKDTTTEFTAPPNAQWTYGTKVEETPEGKAWLEGEKAGWKFIDASVASPVELYTLLVSGVAPRPIAFVSSESANGVPNLAPFSWFNSVTHNPPIIAVSIINVGDKEKDTTTNIKATKQFVVNIISEPFVQQANATSVEAPGDVNEWLVSGLTPAPSTFVKPPRVKESAFALEAELYELIEIKDPKTGAVTTNHILGLIKGIHVRKDILDDKGLVDITKYKAVGRLGDVTYGRIGDVFRVPRPVWADEAEKIRALEKKN